MPTDGRGVAAGFAPPRLSFGGPLGAGGGPEPEPITVSEQQALRRASTRFVAAEVLTLAPLPGVAVGIGLVLAGAATGAWPLLVAGATTWGGSAATHVVGLSLLATELRQAYGAGGLLAASPPPEFGGIEPMGWAANVTWVRLRF